MQVFHVNADDPEAVAWVMSVAAEYRQVEPRSSRLEKDNVSLITAEKTRPFADLTGQHAPFRTCTVMVDNHEAVARVMSVAAEYRQVPPRTLSLITVDNRHRFAHHGREKIPFHSSRRRKHRPDRATRALSRPRTATMLYG